MENQKRKTYTLKGQQGRADISFTIDDLMPLAPCKSYDFDRLVKHLNYTEYDADWSAPMGNEWNILYSNIAHKGVNFFRIKGHKVIVIPGTYIYPTLKKE